MTSSIVLFSRGLWRLRREIEDLSGRRAVSPLSWPSGEVAVAGWGHKPTADTARRYARLRGLPFLAFEDGFLRSLHAGPAQRPSSMVMDTRGIYYDARQPSDLEHMLATSSVSSEDRRLAAELVAQIQSRGLSKYNTGSDQLPGDLAAGGRRLVVLVDQTRGDASVAGGLADATSFRDMAAAALAENPGARIVAKLHPEVLSGRKPGYLGDLARQAGVQVLTANINPHALLALKPKVYTVSSQLGFEAALAGCDVHCYGMPFYAGWGLTVDRLSVERRGRKRDAMETAAICYLHYSRYFDCWTRERIDAFKAVEQLDFLRRDYLGKSQRLVCVGLPAWKRRAVTAMATGPAGPPRFARSIVEAVSLAQQDPGVLAAWGPRANRLRNDPRCQGLQVMTIEDGFLRSAGLGAAFVEPRSLVFDANGIYYDPTTASDLVRLLETRKFAAKDLERIRSLRQELTAQGISKYNLREEAPLPALPTGREVILVVGQVADDAAVTAASEMATENINDWLLAAVRRDFPQSYVIFKPHPDVERMGRAGALTAPEVLRLADLCVPDLALDRLLPHVHRVATYSSLGGFEALLRDVAVTVYGRPFYAGWGLTDDRRPDVRRGRQVTRDELAAAALLDYPRYWDPESGLACRPEQVVRRLAAGHGAPGVADAIRQLAGRAVILWRRFRNAAIRPRHDRVTDRR